MIKQRQRERIKAGRTARLKAEITCTASGEPLPDIPLFSYDATIQSYFERGWHGVTPTDIRIELLKQQQQSTGLIMNVGEAARRNIAVMLGRA